MDWVKFVCICVKIETPFICHKMMMIMMMSLFHAYPFVHFPAHWSGVSTTYQQRVEKVPMVSYSKQDCTVGDELLMSILTVHPVTKQLITSNYLFWITTVTPDCIFLRKGSFVCWLKDGRVNLSNYSSMGKIPRWEVKYVIQQKKKNFWSEKKTEHISNGSSIMIDECRFYFLFF